jgi:hypothetical protein
MDNFSPFAAVQQEVPTDLDSLCKDEVIHHQ